MLQRLSQQRWVKWVRDLGVALALLSGLRFWQQRGMAEGKAPALAGVTTAGDQVSLTDYRGEPALVVFWATWCGTCRVEQDNIEALSKDYPVVTVASQSGAAGDVAGYLSEHGLSFATVPDPGGALAKRFSVRAYPSMFVVDGQGHIDSIEVGYTSELGLRARMWLAGL